MPSWAKVHHGKIDWCLACAYLIVLATVISVAVGLGLGFVRFDFWHFDPTSWTTPLALFLFILVVCVSLTHRFVRLRKEYNDAAVAHTEKSEALRRDKEAELNAREDESEHLRKLLESNAFALQTNERVIAEAHKKLSETITDFEGMSKFAVDVESRVSRMMEESSHQEQAAEELKAEHGRLCTVAAMHKAELTHHISTVRDAYAPPAVSETDELMATETLRMAAKETLDNCRLPSPPLTTMNFSRANYSELDEENLSLALVLRDQESDFLATQRQLSLLQREHDWVSEQLSKESRKVSKLESRTHRYEARLQMFKQMQNMVSESHSMLKNCQENISKERTAQACVQQHLEHEKARSQFLRQLLWSLQMQLQGVTDADSDDSLLSLLRSLGDLEEAKEEKDPKAHCPSGMEHDVKHALQAAPHETCQNAGNDSHAGASSGSEQGSGHTGVASSHRGESSPV